MPRSKHWKWWDFVLDSSIIVAVAGHGGLSTPLPRNSFGHPLHVGPPQALPKFFSNYYDDGCAVGCDSCLHHGPKITNESVMNPWGPPFNCNCTVNGIPVGPGLSNISLPGADTLPRSARTWNRLGDHIDASVLGDWNRFQPWRAPGAAVVLDPCGVLCDHCQDPDNASRPILSNGTDLPELPSTPTKWLAGGVAEVGWALMVNHGGGYQYRLCKKHKDERPTEACFQMNVLAFADEMTVRGGKEKKSDLKKNLSVYTNRVDKISSHHSFALPANTFYRPCATRTAPSLISISQLWMSQPGWCLTGKRGEEIQFRHVRVMLD